MIEFLILFVMLAWIKNALFDDLKEAFCYNDTVIYISVMNLTKSVMKLTTGQNQYNNNQ